jgi:hypothetical protein
MSVDSQLASGHAPVLVLVEMQFSTGTSRVTNWGHNVDWAGHTWSALAAVTSLSAVKVSERNQYPAMDLGLQVGDNATLAAALGNPSTYRGKPVSIYQAFLDDELRPLGDPELAWGGEMSQIRINTGDGEQDRGSIVMRCEHPGRDSRGVRSLRLNNAQHQARWPGDTLLSRIEKLAGQPQPWLSVRFQRI